ncbi:MAG: hypothetical protein ACTSRS_13385 [Candidatus Helarchaeota archaeon]
MLNRDILWAISIPFRMYNTKEMGINQFIFTLSFDTALPDCNVSIARKLASFALQKGWLEKLEEKKVLRAKFELWEPKFFPPSWHPKFSDLEKVPLIDLEPLESHLKYEPRIGIREKQHEIKEESAFSRLPQVEKETRKIPEEPKELPKKAETLPRKKKTTKKKKISSPKKQEITKKKKRGQKSIQDFFSGK